MRGSLVGWTLGGVAVALGLAAGIFNVLAGSHGDPWWYGVLYLAGVLASIGVGLLIALRRPENPIGWLLLVNGVLLALYFAATAYASYALLEQPGELSGGRLAALWDYAGWPSLFAALTTIAFVFPDGRLPSPRWRPVAIGGVLAFVTVAVTQMLHPGPFDPPYEHVKSPLPKAPDAFEPLFEFLLLGLVAALVAAVAALRMRFRRADTVERLQLRWLAYAGLLIPLTFLVCIADWTITGEVGDATVVALTLTQAAIPVSIGVAVLRYRLYKIDRIINRTLVYGVLTVLLAAAYGATALLLGTALGSGSAWTTAGATLAVAVAFRPLRIRVQDMVDRRFARARHDALRRIADFLEELRAGRSAPEEIEPLLREIVCDPELELRFFLPASAEYVDARGRAVSDAPGDRRERTPVERAGEPLGIVLHGPVDAERAGLLWAAVEAAGLAIEIARLRVELRRQLAEVEASRARIVSAGYQERRRLERDLHDGAQQRLVSIGLQLRHAQHGLGPTANGARATLDRAVAEVAAAIEELRELARGVRPAQLDEGLAPALTELAARAPLQVEVSATRERFDPDLEAAAYFIASEALTNAIKHAGASKVALRAKRGDASLAVEVSDNGVGGADPAAGSGLRGLSDRVAAHGGTLTIDSEPEAGTTVRAELPCAS